MFEIIYALFAGVLAFVFTALLNILIWFAIPYGFMMACIKNPLMRSFEKRFNLNDDPDDPHRNKKDMVFAGLGCFAILMFVLGAYLSSTYLLPIFFDIGR